MILLAGSLYKFLGLDAVMKQATILERPTWHETKYGLWVRTEALSPAALKVLYSADNNLSWELYPSPVKLSDESSALANTLTVVLEEILGQRT